MIVTCMMKMDETIKKKGICHLKHLRICAVRKEVKILTLTGLSKNMLAFLHDYYLTELCILNSRNRPGRGIVGSSGRTISNFLRNSQIDFQSGCTSLQSH